MDNTWHIDKDILIKGNRIYSAINCCLVPQEINKLFTKRQNKRGNYPIGVTKKRNKFYAITSKTDKSRKGGFNTPEEAFECYKFNKELRIRDIADKWKLKITEDCYFSMLEYQVEIVD